MMGRLRETASFHRRLKNTDFISKKIPFPNRRAYHGNNIHVRKIKDPCLVEIRNKHTKELVDIEVGGSISFTSILCHVTSVFKILQDELRLHNVLLRLSLRYFILNGDRKEDKYT